MTTKQVQGKVVEPNNVPKLEIRLTQSWTEFIRFCQAEAPYSDVTVKIVNGNPTKLISFKRDVRFDRKETIPYTFNEES